MPSVTVAEATVAACLGLLALAHSVLGERELLRPLFAADWELATVPRWAATRILRFAWHLTSIAWVGLAAHFVGIDIVLAVAVVALVSAAMIFLSLPGHLGWPLFFLAGLAALRIDGVLTDTALTVGAAATAITLALLSLLHLYWAAGGSWMKDSVLPQTADSDTTTLFSPGPLVTVAVALLLAAFATLVTAAAGLVEVGPTRLIEPALWAGVAVLTARAVGDGRYAGFTKKVRGTAFSRADDAVFTPLVVALALGSSAAALAG